MTGTVVTFYSYKGGVGRSFTLANIAILLARWGYRVLAIDWDLEAPGLHQYFGSLMDNQPRSGLVDLVDDFTNRVSRPATHLTRLHLEGPGSVDLLAAGRQDSAYVGRVQRIDWAGLYESGFADFLERRRAEWTAENDFVLIDSRTGISDSGGICTAHLPDRLAMVFTPNVQSIEGVVDLAGRADRARDRMPFDRPPLTVLPILSRLDSRVEYVRAEQWHRKCAELTTPLFRNWLDRNVAEELMLRHSTVPYVSYWSFGEQLPVLEEQTPSADQISYALETVAAIIAHQYDRTDLLADNRDAYVAAARAPGREFDLDILVSSPRSAMRDAEALIDELRALGLRADRSLSGDIGFLDKAKDPARHLCLVVDGEVSRWQTTEAERFLRHTLSDGGDRRLFSVLTRATDPERLPPFLRNLQHLEFGVAVRPRDVARTLHGDLTGNGSAPQVESNRLIHQDAAAALRQLPSHVPYSYRWDVVEQIVAAMADALNRNETAALRDLTLDLEIAGRIRASQHSADRFETPDSVRRLIGDLLSRFDRRISVS
jgi:MinD-like ATPase involved in chromosome partitioning or flagellar assembly